MTSSSFPRRGSRALAPTGFLLLVALGLWPGSLTGQEIPTVEDLERKYKRLAAEEDPGVAELFKLGAWCQQVSLHLPAEARRRFQERGRRCIFRAEGQARDGLRQLYARARQELESIEDYPQARQVADAVRTEGEAYLENLFTLAGAHVDRESFVEQLGEQDRILRESLQPLRARHESGHLESGRVLFAGEWIDADTPRPEEGFLGRVALSELRQDPESHDEGTIITDIVTRGRTFELLDLWLLDGFDDRGEYMPPHFMPERLVLHLDGGADWKERLERFAGPPDSGKTSPFYRFQLSLRIRQVSRQHCRHYQGDIRQIAIFDESGKRLDFLEPSEEDER